MKTTKVKENNGALGWIGIEKLTEKTEQFPWRDNNWTTIFSLSNAVGKSVSFSATICTRKLWAKTTRFITHAKAATRMYSLWLLMAAWKCPLFQIYKPLITRTTKAKLSILLSGKDGRTWPPLLLWCSKNLMTVLFSLLAAPPWRTQTLVAWAKKEMKGFMCWTRMKITAEYRTLN